MGIAQGPPLPDNTGYRPPDAINLWAAIIDGGASPRTEVVHQVENQWSCDVTQPNGGCVSSMRMGEMKVNPVPAPPTLCAQSITSRGSPVSLAGFARPAR